MPDVNARLSNVPCSARIINTCRYNKPKSCVMATDSRTYHASDNEVTILARFLTNGKRPCPRTSPATSLISRLVNTTRPECTSWRYGIRMTLSHRPKKKKCKTSVKQQRCSPSSNPKPAVLSASNRRYAVSLKHRSWWTSFGSVSFSSENPPNHYEELGPDGYG